MIYFNNHFLNNRHSQFGYVRFPDQRVPEYSIFGGAYHWDQEQLKPDFDSINYY